MNKRTKHKRIVVFDSVTLTRQQWKVLQSLSEQPLTVLRGEKGDSINVRTRKNIYPRAPKPDTPNAIPEDEIYCGLQMCVPQIEREEMVELLRGSHGSGTDCVVTCWTPIPNNVISELTELGIPIRTISAWTNFVLGRIDVDYAQSKGIEVSMIPDYGTEAVSQYVFAMIYYQLLREGKLTGKELALAQLLAETRSITKQIQATRSQQWRFEELKHGIEIDMSTITEHTLPKIERVGDTLAGKKIGIIGMGRIGKRVSTIAQTLGMEVMYYTRDSQSASLEEIFSSCDYVSVHLPPNGAQGLITSDLISRMKPGSAFINTSVGNVVEDEKQLFVIARQKGIALLLDVYQRLPPLSEIKKTLRINEKLILATYRNAWYTCEALMVKGWRLVQNIIRPLDIALDAKEQIVGKIEEIIQGIRTGLGESVEKVVCVLQKLEKN